MKCGKRQVLKSPALYIPEKTLTSIKQIASKLTHSISLQPINIYSNIEDSRYNFIKTYPHLVHASPDPALLHLRLVSKAFRQVATRVLFRSHRIIWQVNPHSWSGLERANALNESIEKFLFGSINMHPMVRHLKISQPRCLLPSTEVGEDGASTEFLRLLPEALKQLSNLNSLSIYPGSLESDEPGDLETAEPKTWNNDRVSQLLSGLATVFYSEKLENLTDLRLFLPCTHNFAEINASMSDSFANRLVYLYLGITVSKLTIHFCYYRLHILLILSNFKVNDSGQDCTGPGGTSNYLYNFDDDGDGDEEYQVSNLQMEFPNQEYQKALFDIVCRCRNLEVLGLKGTQRLDLKQLDWTPASKGLRAIELDRVKTSVETLVNILSPSEETPLSDSILKNINFVEVDLETGSWEDIFTFLSGLPSLLFFNPENLRYTRGHPSFTTGGRAWEDCRNVWSEMGEEEETLLRLTEALVAKAGGVDEYPNYWMEQNMLG